MDKWVAMLIRVVLERISPEVGALIREGLQKAKEAAAKTANPFDDILVDALMWLVGPK